MPADATVRALIKEAKKAIQKKYNTPIRDIEPHSYRKQVVAGFKYDISVTIHEANGRSRPAQLSLYKRPGNGRTEVTALRVIVV